MNLIRHNSKFQTTYCFLHALNTNVGRITIFPVAKKIVALNTKIVTFFRSSHYWSGQLDVIKKRLGVTRSLKTHTASRWYSLILQAQSVQEHRYVYLPAFDSSFRVLIARIVLR